MKPPADRLFDALALAGGFALLGAAGLVTASVMGRAAFDAPIEGDYELVKLALGFAAFAFLPLTEVRGGHVAADTFIERFSGQAKARIEAFWHGVQGVVFVLLAYAMALGTLSMRLSGETTMERGLPLWPGLALASLCAGLGALAAFLRAWRLARS